MEERTGERKCFANLKASETAKVNAAIKTMSNSPEQSLGINKLFKIINDQLSGLSSAKEIKQMIRLITFHANIMTS